MNNSPLSISQKALHWLEYALLIIITLATIVAVGQEIFTMVGHMSVQIADLLLLFIYLEIITMVIVYLQSGSVPVRMPLYIGMVALARYLILDMKAMDTWQMLAISGSILLIAFAVLVVRFGHVKYPYEQVKQGHFPQ
ncbi:phosphate-starvation-inducible protein PsiE [Thiothrix nivea]|uniref:Protein PsiE n=1 Tax=Thiothrix nivea (strain ATCC 35100 / DSM 5205 / JP2) TaxID=870187 RepID=A0A656HL78_THINJ|nr:phosphate-starvation-inducible PsiE family protein [Thiothrix nivea]EIJ35775.1 phosphate-starvation-inducible E [Thiothrix nivea DSM 5205]